MYIHRNIVVVEDERKKGKNKNQKIGMWVRGGSIV
jgi:hypothetical protein